MQTHTAPTTHRPADISMAPASAAGSLLDELLTTDQVAGILQMRLSTVEDYARRGVLPSVKLGRHRRFIRSEVEDAILAIAQGPRRTRSPRPSSLPSRRSPSSPPGRTR